MKKKTTLTVLPLTENYSKKNAGAVSLFVKDINKYSKFNNFIVGSTKKKDLISNNYQNFNPSRSIFNLSKNKLYAKQVLDFVNQNNLKIIY